MDKEKEHTVGDLSRLFAASLIGSLVDDLQLHYLNEQY